MTRQFAFSLAFSGFMHCSIALGQQQFFIQQWNEVSTGHTSRVSSCNEPETEGAVVVDDFSFDESGVVDAIVWWGNVFDPAQAREPRSYYIAIYADTGNCEPGLLLHEECVQPQVSLAGLDCEQTGVGRFISLLTGGFTAAARETYWLQISEDNADSANLDGEDFRWSGRTPVVGCSADQIDGDGNIDNTLVDGCTGETVDLSFGLRASVIDNTPPELTLVINGDAEFTNSGDVTIELMASDDLSGVADMRWSINSLDEEGFSAWEPFDPNPTLPPLTFEGTNFINFEIRDAAGNVRFEFESIVLDRTAPAVTVVLNAGDKITNSGTLLIEITAADESSGVTEMRWSINSLDEEDFSTWEPFDPNPTLPPLTFEGTNFVNFEIRDAVKNVGFGFDSIILDLK